MSRDSLNNRVDDDAPVAGVAAGHAPAAAATVGPRSAHSTRRQAFMPTPVAALLDCVRNILHGSSALRALIHASIVHRTGSA